MMNQYNTYVINIVSFRKGILSNTTLSFFDNYFIGQLWGFLVTGQILPSLWLYKNHHSDGS